MSAEQTAAERTVIAPPRAGLPAAVLLVIYVGIGLLPLYFAWGEHATIGGFWRAFSNGLAMVAFALLMVQFFLSGRLRWVSGRVGIDRLMRFHNLAARMITVGLLLHPFLYLMRPLLEDGPGAAFARLAGFLANPAFTSGITAWLLLIVLMALALLREWLPIRYEAWRISHGLGAAAILTAGLHHTITVGTNSQSLQLAQMWIMLGLLAMAALFYLYLARPWQLSQRPFYVSHIARAGEKLWSVTVWPAKLQPVGALASFTKPRVTPRLEYEAGQFVWLTLGASPFIMADHPFSVVSSPSDGAKLKFLIKESGDFTGALGSLPAQSRAYVDGPYGRFTLSVGEAAAGGRDKVAGLAFIAGGVGIAPIASILRDRKAAGETRPMRLLTGNRAASQLVFREEWDEMAATMNFRADHVLADPPHDWPRKPGILDEQTVFDWVDWPQPERWLYFVCGPNAMIDAVFLTLRERGVPASRIVFETFRYD